MIMAQKTFKRYELKFRIDEEKFDIIKEHISEYMNPDEYCKNDGSYMIYNVYFDTDNDEIIRKSIAKPYYKEKLRLRSYKIPESDKDRVFLELKKKIGGIVSKRRATMSYGSAIELIRSGQKPTTLSYTDNMVLDEIAEFLKRYPAKPKVFLSYERIAFHGKDDHEFRVTFDKNILTRRENPSFYSGDYGSELLSDGSYLMEVKINGAFPLWFAEMLSELEVYTSGFSKYGEEYKKYARSKQSKEITNQVSIALSNVLLHGLKKS